MHGYHGKVLHIDLTEQTYCLRPLEPSRLRMTVGGVGLGSSLLFEHAPPGVDPFARDNPIVFASAPLVGTGLTTTAKYAVVTKSPLTGFIADSLSSSYFALELKKLGSDALVITGRAAKPVYLFLRNESVEFRDARAFWGMSPLQTEASIKKDLRDKEVRIASIGLAGENRVRFATLSNEGRHAGRGGVGAVFGSKNLKAIAIRGSRNAGVADPKQLEQIGVELRKASLGPQTAKYREIGTVANLSVFNRLGSLPVHNFQKGSFPSVERLSGETLREEHGNRAQGCASCTIRCERQYRTREGAHQRLEYETLFAFGPHCGLEEPDAILEAARLCDEYGLDTISTGGTIAWAIECVEKNLLPWKKQKKICFGDSGQILELIRNIAARRGLGSLLADGSARASRLLGGGSEAFAIHVKGLELPGYEPRSLKTLALGLAVSPRGACHNRSGAYEADFSGRVDRFRGSAERGGIVVAAEDFSAVLDSLVVCKFLRRCFSDFYAESAQILNTVTGWSLSGEDLRRVGERVITIKKLFNIREGWRSEDDWLPERLLTETLSDGPAQGSYLTPLELQEMIYGYYSARGWDEKGIPMQAKRAELSL